MECSFFVCVVVGINIYFVDFWKLVGGFIYGFWYIGKFDLNLVELFIYLDIGIC